MAVARELGFGEAARTWGDALRYRTGKQGKQNGQRFPEDGSPRRPWTRRAPTRPPRRSA